jgi:hypothetical protein
MSCMYSKTTEILSFYVKHNCIKGQNLFILQKINTGLWRHKCTANVIMNLPSKLQTCDVKTLRQFVMLHTS